MAKQRWVPPATSGGSAKKARFHPKASDETGSTQGELVKICFKHFDRGCLDSDQNSALNELFPKLAQLSTMTWQQVQSAPRTGAGCEIIPREKLKFTLPKAATPDVGILAFRTSAPGRVMGYRMDAILRVLWFTPIHDAY